MGAPFGKSIWMLYFANTRGTLQEASLEKFLQHYPDYNLCCLFGNHSDHDIELILKYVPAEKIVGLLGSDNSNYLEKYGLSNIDGKTFSARGIKMLGMGGGLRYRPGNYPSYTQAESIAFFRDKPKVDVLLSHASAYDKNSMLDTAHQGLVGITEYLKENYVPIHIHCGSLENKVVEHKSTATISVHGVGALELQKELLGAGVKVSKIWRMQNDDPQTMLGHENVK